MRRFVSLLHVYLFHFDPAVAVVGILACWLIGKAVGEVFAAFDEWRNRK